ncbi:uncharacterized protein ACO6RY_01165 [Pungitius sinensis]
MWARISAFFGYRKADDLPATVKRARDDNTQEEDARGALNYPDNDSASTSADTGSCNTSVEVVGRRGNKRKVTSTESGPRRKRKRRLVTEDREEETKQKEFEAKYEELDPIGEGGWGSVYAGRRRADNLPVAIKHITEVCYKHVDIKGKPIPSEVAIMLNLAAETEGASPYVSILDWYQLEGQLVLVMERPMPAKDYNMYLHEKRIKEEDEAKIILRQLVDAALDLESKNIFHRDIKLENLLIETSLDVPRVRLIDFGVSCFNNKRIYTDLLGLDCPEYHMRIGDRAGPTTVFQIGVVLYDALHTEKRFDTKSFIQGFQCLPNRISKDCKDFLQMCLRVHPNDRPTLEQLRNHQWLR